MESLTNTYHALKDKYEIPSYEEMDRYYSIHDIEKTNYLLREIKLKVMEKIEDSVKILEPLIQPETTLIQLYEYKEFSDSERDKVYLAFKKLMKYGRKALILDIEHDDKLTAEFIAEFHEVFKKMKPLLVKTLETLSHSWETETTIVEDNSYLG